MTLYMVRFVLQHKNGNYFSKDLDWVDGLHASAIFSCEHQDQALNKLVELNAKDINLRAQVVAYHSDNQEKLAPIDQSPSTA